MKKPNALLIEDNPDYTRLISRLLERNDWHCEPVADLLPGIARANAKPFPEVILTDLCLPGFTPHQTLERLPELMRNGPLVVLSNYKDREVEAKVLSLGAYFCPKQLDAPGEQKIFGAIVEAIQKFRDSLIVGKKRTGPIDLNILEQQAILPILARTNGQ